jgi:hypothetical protein
MSTRKLAGVRAARATEGNIQHPTPNGSALLLGDALASGACVLECVAAAPLWQCLPQAAETRRTPKRKRRTRASCKRAARSPLDVGCFPPASFVIRHSSFFPPPKLHLDMPVRPAPVAGHSPVINSEHSIFEISIFLARSIGSSPDSLLRGDWPLHRVRVPHPTGVRSPCVA